MNNCLLFLYSLFTLCVFIQSSHAATATAFAPFQQDAYSYGTCSCLQNYTCTSSSSWDGIASFHDPIPQDVQDATITAVTVSMTGDPFCSSGTNSFHLGLKLNDVALQPLIDTGSYNCYCHCYTVSNQTTFNNGLTGYKRNAVNKLTTSVVGSTVACFKGYQVTVTYNQNAPPPPSPPPPSPSPPSGGDGYLCCVYVSTTGSGAYDITCTNSGSCREQVGYNTITHHSVSSCSECFDE